MRNYKYSDESIKQAVEQSASVSAVLRVMGIKVTGGNHSHMSRRIKAIGLDTSHFTGRSWNKGGTNDHCRKSAAQILVTTTYRVTAHQLRRSLLEIGREHRCEGCGIGPEWNGLDNTPKPLTLEIDHMDGNPFDNRADNLRFLYPNCHSQCETNRPWKNT